MGVVPIDGRVKVTWLNAVANVSQPTTTELNGGTALEGLITPDGLDISSSTGKVKTSNLGSKQTTNKAGRKAYDIKVMFHHDGVVDTAYNLLTYQTSGFLAVRRGIDKTVAWTAAQKVEIYPVDCAERNETKPSEDGTWDFEVEMFTNADADTRAVIA
jgi:hypothetical protein